MPGGGGVEGESSPRGDSLIREHCPLRGGLLWKENGKERRSLGGVSASASPTRKPGVEKKGKTLPKNPSEDGENGNGEEG